MKTKFSSLGSQHVTDITEQCIIVLLIQQISNTTASVQLCRSLWDSVVGAILCTHLKGDFLCYLLLIFPTYILFWGFSGINVSQCMAFADCRLQTTF